jgi:superfamily II DNA or RNA helicase
VQCLQRLYLRRQAAAQPLFCPRPPVIIRPSGISPSTAPFPPTREGCSAALGGEEGLALGAGGSSPGAALLYLPTGGGKTRIAGELARWVLRLGGAVLFVVNRTVLVSQAAEALKELGVAAGEVCVWGGAEAGGGGEDARLHIATVQSLAARQRGAAAAAAASAGGGAGGPPPLPRFDCLILDEAHGAVAPSYAPLWAATRSCSSASGGAVPWPVGDGERSAQLPPPPRHAHPFVVGLTATPVRLGDAESLGRHFDVLVNGPSLSALVGAGVLVPPLVFAGHAEHLAKALKCGPPTRGAPPPQQQQQQQQRAAKSGGGHLLLLRGGGGGGGGGGESDEEEAEEEDAAVARHFAAAAAGVDAALQRDDTLDAVVALWRAKCGGGEGGGGGGGGGGAPPSPRATLVFAPSVAASLAVVAAFARAGVPAAHVDGATPPAARAAAYAALCEGATTLLSSVGVLSEGFDEPRVAAVVLLRPTASRGLYVQQVGRGLRGAPGKANCIVLDFVDATVRHGPVTRPLLAAEGGGGGGEEGAPRAAGIPGAALAGGDEAAAAAARRAAAAGGGAAAEARGAREAAARVKAEALKNGLRRVWLCGAKGCRAINHVALAHCAACGASALAAPPAPAKQQKLPQPLAAAAAAGAGAEAAAPPPPPQQQQPPAPGGKVQTTLSALVIPRKPAPVIPVVPRPAPPPPPAEEAEAAALGAALAALTMGAGGAENAPPPPPLKQQQPAPRPAAAALAAPQPPSGGGGGGGGGPRHGGCDATFALPSFAAACRAQALPVFTLAAGRTPWERGFLLSMAAQITPGVPHEWKRVPEDAKPVSANQREVLQRLAARK